jgi:hypothetical protein
MSESPLLQNYPGEWDNQGYPLSGEKGNAIII